MYYSIIKLSFLSFTLMVFVGSGLVNFFEECIPDIIIKSFRYGKFAYKKSVLGVPELPKRYFKHFYAFALLWSTYVFARVSYVYLYSGQNIESSLEILDYIASKYRITTVDATRVYLAVILLMIQSWKRFYETFFVSIFSDTKINFFHYFLGFYHYFGAFIAIVAEAPGFSHSSSDFSMRISLSDLKFVDILCSVIFLWASWNQLKSAETLANLRKNKKGHVVSLKHEIPKGGLFAFVSSPHMTCEIIMYTCLTVILWQNTTWFYIFLWVLSNQMETSLLNHWWYKEKFSNYPKDRKAVIPYVL